MDSILQDLRYAARRLLRAPAFTITAVLTLAIGIGAVTSVFSLVDGVLLRSLPFPASDRLMNVMVAGTPPYAVYDVLKGVRRAFEGAAALDRSPMVLSSMGPARWINANRVTASLFPLLGVQPSLGRLLVTSDDSAGSPPVAVLSYGFWSERLGRDPNALGHMIRLDSTSYQVVGVASPTFQYPADADMWCNLGPDARGSLANRPFWTLARLRPGITALHAESELKAALRGAADRYPTVRSDPLSVGPLQGFLVENVRSGILILMGAVGLLLLTAATNVASLFVSRVTDRNREMSVRTALGARRSRLATMVLSESLLLALAGGALGVVFADWALQGLVTFLGTDLPRIMQVGVNSEVLAAAVAISVLSGVLAGVFPAIHASSGDPIAGVKGYGPHGSPHRRPGDTLVIAQVALTVVLLSGAGLLGRSFWRLATEDPGFDASGVVDASLWLPASRYPTAAARAAYAAEALERARTLPGVTAAAVSTGLPLAGMDISSIQVAGRAAPETHWAWIAKASPDYLSVLRIPLKRGHWATDDQSVVIDEAAARTYFPGEDPLGRRIANADDVPRTIVGVVGNTRQESLSQDPPPHLYYRLSARVPPYLQVLVREGSTEGGKNLRATLEALDPAAPITIVESMTTRLASSLADERAYAVALGVFAIAALSLAGIGIYGLASNVVARRTREIGIRVALGAARMNVVTLVLGRGVALTMLGLVIGLIGEVLGSRVLRTMLFEVGPGDPVVLAAVVSALIAATIAATYFPARRAAAVDPVVALRAE